MARIALVAVILLVPACFPSGDSKDNFAVMKIRHLATACESYKKNNGDWPPSLDALAQPQPKVGNPLVPPDVLADEWGKPFHYDPAGPRNNGERPDIWCETPQGRVLGSWEFRR